MEDRGRRTWAGGGPPIRSFALLSCLLASLHPVLAAADPTDGGLLDLSIAELLHVEVTSASKKSQPIDEIPAAVFVITQSDIQRSGARNIPEALRMAPGLDVAQIDANKWAVSARGFNGRFANKLLVLMDGRALYTPSFGGVFWDVQDTVMEDIDRIEVIRGPGGTLWGANAVNGVINIITRSAKATQGGELIAAAATGPSGEASLRYGDRLGDTASYRLYGKYLDEAGNEDYAGVPTADASHLGRVGLRADWDPNERDQISLTSEAYDGRSGETLSQSILTPPYYGISNSGEYVSGFFSTVRWQRTFSDGRELQAHAYYDATDRNTVLFGEDRRSAVLELQYHSPLGARQDVVVGAGYRYDRYYFDATNDVVVTPQQPGNAGYDAFVQDEVRLVPDRLALTIGVDVEHNPLSDKNLNALPSGRLLWSINDANRLWGAVTEAVGTPSYEETGAYVRNASPVLAPGSPTNPLPVPLVTSAVGNPAFRSEELLAYELGYRTQVAADLTLDATLFLHEYRQLWAEAETGLYCEPGGVPLSVNPLCVLGASYAVSELMAQNALRGHSSGVELAADWAPTSRLRLRFAYTWLDLNLVPSETGAGVAAFAAYTAGQDPAQQFSLRGDVALTRQVDLDVSVRHVDALPAIAIPAYWSADANLTWRPTGSIEVALTGRNLLQASHAEFISEFADVVPTRIERTAGARLRWKF